VINSLKPSFFPQNIVNALLERRNKYNEKNNKFIKLTNEMYTILKNSYAFPSSKYQTVTLLHLDQRGKALSMLNMNAKPRVKPKRTDQKRTLKLSLGSVPNDEPRKYLKGMNGEMISPRKVLG
jgi:hypothetical protein